MTLVETIRYYCKQKKTSIAALERELGFGNGTIRKWDKSPTSYERLQAVASALGVTVSDLTGEEQKEKPASEVGSGPLDYELLTDENKAKAQEYIRLLLNSQS